MELLQFIEESRYNRYRPLDDLIDILNDFNLSEKERMIYARAHLQFHGLTEVTLIDSNSKEQEIIWEPRIFKGTINPIQLFDIHFTNGKIDFWQNLN